MPRCLLAYCTRLATLLDVTTNCNYNLPLRVVAHTERVDRIRILSTRDRSDIPIRAAKPNEES